MSRPEPVYLLLGPENGDKTRFIEDIAASLAAARRQAPERHKFYAFERPFDEVVGILRNGSLFSSHRLVVYACVEELKRAEDIELVEDLVRHPVSDATLVCTSDDTTVDRRLQRLFDGPRKRVFWEMFENQKVGWVIARFRRDGVEITPAAAELLLRAVRNTTDELDRECGMLATYFGPGRRIDDDEIENYLVRSRDETVFSLFERVAGGDLPTALEAADSTLGTGTAVQVVAGLVWQYQLLNDYKALAAGNLSPEDIFKRLKLNGKRMQRAFVEADRVLSEREAEEALVLLADCDEQLRSGRADLADHLLKMAVYRLTKRRFC